MYGSVGIVIVVVWYQESQWVYPTGGMGFFMFIRFHPFWLLVGNVMFNAMCCICHKYVERGWHCHSMMACIVRKEPLPTAWAQVRSSTPQAFDTKQLHHRIHNRSTASAKLLSKTSPPPLPLPSSLYT